MSNVLARLQGVSDMEFYRVALDLNTELSAFLMSEKNVPKKWRAVYTYPILALMESLFDYIEDANAIWPNTDDLVAERKRLQKECINCVTKIYGKLQRSMRVVWWQKLHMDESSPERCRIEYHMTAIGEMLNREEALLTGWRKSTRLIKS